MEGQVTFLLLTGNSWAVLRGLLSVEDVYSSKFSPQGVFEESLSYWLSESFNTPKTKRIGGQGGVSYLLTNRTNFDTTKVCHMTLV
jgi:hypothetical protein